jgi:hypothetical protein
MYYEISAGAGNADAIVYLLEGGTTETGTGAKVWYDGTTDIFNIGTGAGAGYTTAMSIARGSTTVSFPGIVDTDALKTDHFDDSGAGEIEIQTILDCDQHASGRLVVPVGANQYATR